MFDWFIESAIAADAWLRELASHATLYFSDLTPSQKVATWLQIVVGCLSILWIMFQFAWMRRLNEAKLEKYLEDRIISEREDLADERAQIFSRLDRLARRSSWTRLVRLWAHVRLTLSFLLRVLSIGTFKGFSSDPILFFAIGSPRKAREQYTETALTALKKLKLYEEALGNKKREAQNALLFAGYMADAEGRGAAAVASYRRAIRIQDDAEARLLVAQKIMQNGDLETAMRELNVLVAADAETTSAETRAEAHRKLARIHISLGRAGLARRHLESAGKIDERAPNYRALGEIEEMLGDINSRSETRKAAARRNYGAAKVQYLRANATVEARSVSIKLSQLSAVAGANDGWLTRRFERAGQILLTRAERRRDRARTKVH